jgi:hypothetical protein
MWVSVSSRFYLLFIINCWAIKKKSPDFPLISRIPFINRNNFRTLMLQQLSTVLEKVFKARPLLWLNNRVETFIFQTSNFFCLQIQHPFKIKWLHQFNEYNFLSVPSVPTHKAQKVCRFPRNLFLNLDRPSSVFQFGLKLW